MRGARYASFVDVRDLLCFGEGLGDQVLGQTWFLAGCGFVGLPQASGFSVIALGVMAVTRSDAAFCFFAGAVSSTGSGIGPSDLKTMVQRVEVDSVF